MKTIVVSDRGQTRIPFLRGILVRSLLDAGLDFEVAHALATSMRDRIGDRDEITSDELRSKVRRLLESRGHLGVLESYRLPFKAPARIVVRNRDGEESAFSRNRHELFLRASGMKPERAEQVTDQLYERLLASGVVEITTRQLGYLTWLCLQQDVSKKAARRFLLWTEYSQSARPLILLISGTVGSGKSTVATEVGHVLGIVRIQSTDMLREVMRMATPERLLPVLHRSSFDAWCALPIQDHAERDQEQLLVDGYRSQAKLISVACEAVLQRAVEESVPVILEGVHAQAELLDSVVSEPPPVAVQVTLAVLKAKQLKARLKGRGENAPKRNARRYLERFDSIWSLQSFLLSEADRCDMPIITNEDRDKTVQQVILQVNQELARHFGGTPREVFGVIIEQMSAAASGDSWFDVAGALAE
jgi:2-phosphoglycerate kinase